MIELIKTAFIFLTFIHEKGHAMYVLKHATSACSSCSECTYRPIIVLGKSSLVPDYILTPKFYIIFDRSMPCFKGITYSPYYSRLNAHHFIECLKAGYRAELSFSFNLTLLSGLSLLIATVYFPVHLLFLFVFEAILLLIPALISFCSGCSTKFIVKSGDADYIKHPEKFDYGFIKQTYYELYNRIFKIQQ